MGDFNLQPTETAINFIIRQHDLCDLKMQKTCFKSKSGICIDLIIINHKFSFQAHRLFDSVLSAHQNLIYSLVKLHYTKSDPENHMPLRFLKENNIKSKFIESLAKKLEFPESSCNTYQDVEKILTLSR